jgi:hypothetical protein
MTVNPDRERAVTLAAVVLGISPLALQIKDPELAILAVIS